MEKRLAPLRNYTRNADKTWGTYILPKNLVKIGGNQNILTCLLVLKSGMR